LRRNFRSNRGWGVIDVRDEAYPAAWAVDDVAALLGPDMEDDGSAVLLSGSRARRQRSVPRLSSTSGRPFS
jgi:hypothetical protein